jgi:proteasome assembly chaperone (PAC2) family protein
VTHAGTSALSFLAKRLKAKGFADIDPEEFYDFPTNRPTVTISRGVVEKVTMPASRFYFVKSQDHDLILFLGDEPNLKWHRYAGLMLNFASYWEVDRIYLLGGLYDMVTHTMEAKITGVTSQPHLTQTLKEHNIDILDYQGPSSIYSLILATCRERKIEAISLWGHVPFYIRAESNPLTCLALLNKLAELLEIKLDLADMEMTAKQFNSKLDKLMTQSKELALYIERLERQHEGKARASIKDLQSADRIVKEVEDFLKKERGDEEASL